MLLGIFSFIYLFIDDQPQLRGTLPYQTLTDQSWWINWLIWEALSLLDEVAVMLERPHHVEMALWMHNVVYDTAANVAEPPSLQGHVFYLFISIIHLFIYN